MTQSSQAGVSQTPGHRQRSTGGGPRGRMFPTQNYLAADGRTAVIEWLDPILADATVLRTQAKFAHWNVKGMEFYGLHRLFDEIAEVLERHVDEIAERITALGGQAMGTAGMAVAACTLPAMPGDAVTGREYVEALADRLAIHDATLDEAIRFATEWGDVDTADLLNDLSREVSQYLWFLEAHLQGAADPSPSTNATTAAERSQPPEFRGGQQAETAGPPTPGR